MPFSYKTIIFYFFVIPSLLYAGLITQFTFDFFSYDHLWKAYNALALSIMSGTLDVPFEAIGRESVYYNDKVYFYYGYFPVLLRLILAPFIDLNTVTLARISVWLMTTIGAASLQYALIFYSKPGNSTLPWDFISKTKLILMSLIVWFGSAYFIIIQKGVLYHEAYAASLMFSSMFLVFVYKDVFWDFKTRKYRLVHYALFAALCVHARQTVAVSLYIGVIILIVMMTLDTVNSHKNSEKKIHLKSYLYEFFKNGYKPLFILFLGGALLLLLNYLRFDDLLAMTKGEYGYLRAGEGFSERVCAAYVTGSSRFEIGRIIPNLIYYSVGGSYTHGQLIDYLGLGFVRLEFHAIRPILLWSSIMIVFLFVLWKLIRSLILSLNTENVFTFSLLMAFMISPLIILSYTTVTLRYTSDLWLPLGFTLLIFSQKWLFEDKTRTNYLWYLLPISIVVNVTYSTYVYTEYKKRPFTKTENGLPSEELLNKLYNPKPSTETIDEACKKYDFRIR